MFMVLCLDKPGHLEVRKANRDAHLAWLRQRIEKVVIGGPLLSDDGQSMIGSMLVLDIADRAELDALLADDPYAKAGLFQSVTVHPYKKVLP